MAIILPYRTILRFQVDEVNRIKHEFEREARIDLYKKCAQVVLYEDRLSIKRGISLLEVLVDILQADRWGSDVRTIPPSSEPPVVYAKYRIKVPYDPKVCYLHFT